MLGIARFLAAGPYGPSGNAMQILEDLKHANEEHERLIRERDRMEAEYERLGQALEAVYEALDDSEREIEELDRRNREEGIGGIF